MTSKLKINEIEDSAGGGTTTLNGQQIYSRGNIVGTVSQTAGVPTGAIIERGSNANGDYVKYADGTMICSHLNFSLSTYSAIGNVFRTDEESWTFPAVFSAAPVGYAGSLESSGLWGGSMICTTTNGSFRVYTPITSGTSAGGEAQTVAIGRWY